MLPCAPRSSSSPLQVFDPLSDRGVIFTISSHLVKAVSDVLRIVLAVLPRLRPGVVDHIHDIHIPYA